MNQLLAFVWSCVYQSSGCFRGVEPPAVGGVELQLVARQNVTTTTQHCQDHSVLCTPAAGAAQRPQVQERPSERQPRHCQGAPSRATARLWLCLPTTAAYASGRLPAAYETTCSSKALQICQTGFTSSLHTFTQMASHHQYRDHLDSQICDVGLSQVLEDRTRNANAKACAQLSC